VKQAGSSRINREYLKEKINKFATYSKKKNIRELYKIINKCKIDNQGCAIAHAVSL
jgi:hypothetical protein